MNVHWGFIIVMQMQPVQILKEVLLVLVKPGILGMDAIVVVRRIFFRFILNQMKI